MHMNGPSGAAARWIRRLRSHLAWQWGRACAAPGRLLNDSLGTLWYDRWLRRRSRMTDGLLPSSPRMAVYVLYPRLGLQASHLSSLAYLVRKGFSPLVVSNLPLEQDELDRLRPLCWQVLERPNYGYDFGAYRDGVLQILDEVPDAQRLLLANDSVWFPVPASADWLSQADTLDVDLAGVVSNDGSTDYLSDPGRSQPWVWDPHAPRLHYCSFALLFGLRVLRDPAFRDFWLRLKLTTDKSLTIRRGEVGLSRWIIERGYRHAATLDLARFDQELERMDVPQLQALASHLIIPEDEALRVEQRVLTDPGRMIADPIVLRRFILWATAATGPAYALSHWSIPHRGFGFLKKSPMWLSEPSARITEVLIRRFGDEAMLEEAQRLASGVNRQT